MDADQNRWVARGPRALVRQEPAQGQVSSQQAFNEAYRTLAEEDQFVQRAAVSGRPLPGGVQRGSARVLFRNLLENACKYGRVGTPCDRARVGRAHRRRLAVLHQGQRPGSSTGQAGLDIRGGRPGRGNVSADERDPGSGCTSATPRLSAGIKDGYGRNRIGPGATFKFTIPDLRAEMAANELTGSVPGRRGRPHRCGIHSETLEQLRRPPRGCARSTGRSSCCGGWTHRSRAWSCSTGRSREEERRFCG